MDPKDTEELIRLLQKLQARRENGDFLPFPVWREISKLVPFAAVEVLITRTGRDVLLTKRCDENWNGWHIPGGYVLIGESPAVACARVSDRELGIKVKLSQIIDVCVWKEHPFGNPLSILCVCTAEGKPQNGAFFEEIPEGTITHHKEFLRTFFKHIITL